MANVPAFFQHSSQKLVSFFHVTNIKLYSHKTNKLQNINTVGRRERNISVKKGEIYYLKT